MTVKCPWGRRWGLENKNLKGFQTKTSFAAPGHGYKFRRNTNAIEMQGRGQKRVSGLISETWFFPHSKESERSLNRNRNHLGVPTILNWSTIISSWGAFFWHSPQMLRERGIRGKEHDFGSLFEDVFIKTSKRTIGGLRVSVGESVRNRSLGPPPYIHSLFQRCWQQYTAILVSQCAVSLSSHLIGPFSHSHKNKSHYFVGQTQ